MKPTRVCSQVVGTGLCRALLVMLSVALVLPAAPADAQHVQPPTDRGVRAAIAKAVAYLYSKQDRQGYFVNPHSREYLGGGEALVALAMLRAGESPEQAKLKKTIQFLKTVQPSHTYTRSLRAMVYAHLPGNDYRDRLAADVQWLTKQQRRNGGWGYGPRSIRTRLQPEWTDASNSQLALLALREASDSGVLVSLQALRQAESFWSRLHNPDGGWGYQPPPGRHPPQRAESHGSMTAAGVATYLILADKLGPESNRPYDRGRKRKAGTLAYADRIGRGLKWLDANYRVDKVPKFIWTSQPSQLYYYLFVLLRVGDSAGRWSIGGKAYHADVAAVLLTSQKADGSWNDSVIDTAFAVLAMVKTRAPVAISRLATAPPGDEDKPDAEPDPRDAANIARWLGRQLGTTLAWRRVRADQTSQLRASRLLYINSRSAKGLPGEAEASLVKYVRNGGTCLIQADAKSTKGIVKRLKELFDDYQDAELPEDHPVWSLRFKVEPSDRPKIIGVGDLCRTRIFVLAEDVSGAWHQGRMREFPGLFALAGNIVLYSTGGQEPPGRLTLVAPPQPPPVRTHIPVARLKYGGDYGVCPLAIRRLSRRLAHSLPVGLKELPAADPDGPIDAKITVLWLTGNTPPKFSDAQKDNIRKYLAAGGTLLIDPAVGRKDFRDGAMAVLKDLCGPKKVAPLPAKHPLITGEFAGGMGADLTKLTLLATAGEGASGPAPAKLWAGVLDGRIAAVLSHYGLSCSIEGTPCVGNVGYTTDDAGKLALNVILYAAQRRPSRR